MHAQEKPYPSAIPQFQRPPYSYTERHDSLHRSLAAVGNKPAGAWSSGADYVAPATVGHHPFRPSPCPLRGRRQPAASARAQRAASGRGQPARAPGAVTRPRKQRRRRSAPRPLARAPGQRPVRPVASRSREQLGSQQPGLDRSIAEAKQQVD
jgi:hypothetical protein